QPHRIKTISEFHQMKGINPPEHPLISVVDVASFRHSSGAKGRSLVLDFYSISIKRGLNTKIKYGQQEWDFDAGMLFFIAPGQVFRIEYEMQERSKLSGWILMVHPDMLWNTPLAKGIRRYEYFGYSSKEALFLSDKEEAAITGIARNIEQEYRSNIDKFSHDVIIAHLGLLLTYAERFYVRQFMTRRITSHQILDSLADVLDEYFESDASAIAGLPTVSYIAERLHVSPNYLSSLLKVVTGQGTQQHIHNKLIERAKERLSGTNLSVSEIAYELGFEHPQSFSKLFKTKTNLSPLEFRQSFN
ncbi:MAG TPA: helix-turn-helix transcriptional regulator, partial [Puia sp.]